MVNRLAKFDYKIYEKIDLGSGERARLAYL